MPLAPITAPPIASGSTASTPAATKKARSQTPPPLPPRTVSLPSNLNQISNTSLNATPSTYWKKNYSHLSMPLKTGIDKLSATAPRSKAFDRRAPQVQRYLLELTAWQASAFKKVATANEALIIEKTIEEIQQWIAHSQTNQPLNLEYLGIKTLPELPDWLTHLNIRGNALDMLPKLPPYLEYLNASENQLEQLTGLPFHLKTLNICNNKLSHFSENLPPHLEEIYANNNSLDHLPATFPLTLRVLSVAQNPISHLPETITTLPKECIVNLGDIPISNTIYQRLCQLVFATNYCGPRFYISRGRSATQTTNSLIEALSYWYPNKPSNQIKNKWQALQNLEGAADFSAFLDRLRDSIHFRSKEFREQVSAWVETLAEDKELRELSFAVAKEAYGSCEDRATFVFNAMKNAEINLHIARGQYDTKLDQLLAIARTMFRLNELENIAREKSASLALVDEIEVYLAYQIKLQKQFEFPLATTEMRFFDVSYITEPGISRPIFTKKQKI